MIHSFKHKGLQKYFEHGDYSKIRPAHKKKIRLILSVLYAAKEIRDMNFPGSDLHKLTGNYDNYWQVSVSENWRIIFAFDEGDAFDVDYLDYHQKGIKNMYNPAHPGQVLKELYLEPLGLSVTTAAKALGVTRKTFSELVNQKSGISISMALRLSKAFNTTPELWLNMQQSYDLSKARKCIRLSRVKVLFES